MTEALLFKMKKFILLVVIAVFGLQMKAAEQFDELDLRGGWELVSFTGNNDLFTTPGVVSEDGPALSKCKYLYFGELVNPNYEIVAHLPGLAHPVTLDAINLYGVFYTPQLEEVGEENDDEWIGISDYLISNGNKFHIFFYGYGSIHFVITSLTAEELTVKSYDGNLTANYKRISNPSNVKELTASASAPQETYDLNGTKADSSTKGVKIIRRGEQVSKEIR